MKKIVLAAFVALFATPLFAAGSDISLDINAGYFKAQDSGNGFSGGVGGYYSLMKDSGFLQDLAVGLVFDINHVSGVNGFFIAPELKAVMPYSYAKLGFGFDKFGDNGLGMKFSVGGVMPVAEGMRAGLNFSFGEKLTGFTGWSIEIGPVFSMDL